MDRPIPKVLNFELFQRQACTFVLDVFELGSALRYAVRGDGQDSHLPKEQQRPAFLNKVRDDACVPPTGPNCRAVRSPAWTDLACRPVWNRATHGRFRGYLLQDAEREGGGQSIRSQDSDELLV